MYTEYAILKIFSLFRIFEQLTLALKNRVKSLRERQSEKFEKQSKKFSFPQTFHCIEYISYHSRFLSNSALTLKNRVCPEKFPCIQYTFYI